MISRRRFLTGGLLTLGMAAVPSVVDGPPVALAATSAARGLVNVRDFGAAGDGIKNDTAAIKAALEAARDSRTSKTVYLPAGTYLVTVGDIKSVNLVLYSGCTLLGDGYESVLKVDPASPNLANTAGDHQCFVLHYQSNTILRSLRIDGNKGAIDDSDMTRLHGVLLRSDTTGQKNVILEHLWLHDCPAKPTIHEANPIESFGWNCLAGESNVVVNDVESWGHEGTGLNVGGDWATPNLCHDIRITNCSCHDNSWQGISVYAGQRVWIAYCHAERNFFSGFNFEWASDCEVHGGTVRDTAQYALRVVGDSDTIRFYHVLADGGNYLIGVAATTWPGSTCRVMPQNVELHGCVLAHPAIGHALTTMDKDVTIGPSVPVVVFDSAAAEDYVFCGKRYLGNQFKGLAITSPVTVGQVGSWTGGATNSSYTDADRQNANARVISASSKYQGVNSPAVFRAGRQYYVKARVKLDGAGTWIGALVDPSTGQPVSEQYRSPSNPGDAGWWQWEMLLAPAKDAKLQFLNEHDGPSTLAIDWVNVMQLASGTAMSE